MKKILVTIAILAVLAAGGYYYYQYQKEHKDNPKEAAIEQLAEQTVETKQISTNLHSDNLIQVKFSIELDSKKTKKQSEEIISILESDIIKILSQSQKDDFKDIATMEEKIKTKLNERMAQGKVINVYTTELLIQ